MSSARVIRTRIPEGRRVRGLEYGAHTSRPDLGWAGYHVRIPGGPWVVARLTPASDQLAGTDRDIVRAIREELSE